MADTAGNSPAHSGHLASIELDHAPFAPSALNPALARSGSKTPIPAAPVQREQREKKESLKKRESHLNATSNTSGTPGSSLGKRKADASHSYPSPQRFNVPPPRAQDFEQPKEDVMIPHEPFPIYMPQSERQLYKPTDLAENKRGYRYSRSIADPLFPHKQYYRTTSPPPHCARLSFEDADKWMHFATNALITTNEKGWRMVRSNVCAREGTFYYEIKIHRGVPIDGPDSSLNGPQPHVRFGWARREAPLDAPVGFDGYSYGFSDIRFDTMHRSRPGRLFHAKKPKSKSGKAAPATPVTLAPEDQHVKEGDIIGLEIQLPSLNLHQKIVSGVYNPAVDVGDGFDELRDPKESDVEPLNVVRDRIPVPYKGNSYFETLDLVATKAMENYADRATNLSTVSTVTVPGAAGRDAIKAPPGPNHEIPALRTLPHSAIRAYKNGQLLGTAFENLLAFMPPASTPSKTMGAREGFDDGLIGYFPAVACFFGGVAEVNFGDGPHGFWMPPSHIANPQLNKDDRSPMELVNDVAMAGADTAADSERAGWEPGRRARAIGERYKEQVAEDIVWDLIDEADFYMQDGGQGGIVGSGAMGDAGKSHRLKEESVDQS